MTYNDACIQIKLKDQDHKIIKISKIIIKAKKSKI